MDSKRQERLKAAMDVLVEELEANGFEMKSTEHSILDEHWEVGGEHENTIAVIDGTRLVANVFRCELVDQIAALPDVLRALKMVLSECYSPAGFVYMDCIISSEARSAALDALNKAGIS